MPELPLRNILSYLRHSVAREESGDVTDAQLLDAFVRRRDEAAFELLVWRHAALVLGTCRRLLHDRHEAEDAFQATFLILVRKATTISKRASLGCWLHRVACRVAQRARLRTAKRAFAPLPGEDIPARAEPDEVLWRDLRPVLEEEVNRLPEKYRRPFVLCYLEGNTNEQAARQLGCPKGTVLTRLLRGRERLRNRLTRRGVVLSEAILATLLIPQAADAVPTAALISALVKAATPFAAGNAAAGLVSARTAAWTEGVLKAMFLTKLKITSAVVGVLALAAAGVGLLTEPLWAEQRASQAGRDPARAEARGERGDARAPAHPEARGILKAVDAGKGTLTVAVGDGRNEPEEKTFTVAKNAEIGVGTGGGRRGGAFHEATLADLAPGAQVTLLLADDQKTAVCVLADGPTVQGTLKAVDAEKRTITVATWTRTGRRDEQPEQQEKTYTLAKDGEVAMDDGRGKTFSIKETKLVDLPVGSLATVKLSADLKHVQFIQVEGPTVFGVVKAVDAGKHQIQLSNRSGGRGREEVVEERTIAVNPLANVLLDDGKNRRFSLRQGKLEDIPAGALATMKLAADQQSATVIQVQGPTVYGPIKAVAADMGTITLVLRAARGDTPAEEKTFPVAKDARILLEGKDGKLADLKADETGPAVALKLALDQKAVNSITVGGAVRR
jgi:RNA polymerase sigma factor (sigma-70 family)